MLSSPSPSNSIQNVRCLIESLWCVRKIFGFPASILLHSHYQFYVSTLRLFQLKRRLRFNFSFKLKVVQTRRICYWLIVLSKIEKKFNQSKHIMVWYDQIESVFSDFDFEVIDLIAFRGQKFTNLFTFRKNLCSV